MSTTEQTRYRGSYVPRSVRTPPAYVTSSPAVPRETKHMRLLRESGQLPTVQNEWVIEWPVNDRRDGWGRLHFAAFWLDEKKVLHGQQFHTNPEIHVAKKEASNWTVRLINPPEA
jgi:hypothetical protein